MQNYIDILPENNKNKKKKKLKKSNKLKK